MADVKLSELQLRELTDLLQKDALLSRGGHGVTVTAQLEAKKHLSSLCSEIRDGLSRSLLGAEQGLPRLASLLWTYRMIEETMREESGLVIEGADSTWNVILKNLLALALTTGDKKLELDAHLCLGQDAIARRSRDDLEAHAAAARDLSVALGDPVGQAEAIRLLSRALSVNQEFTPARKLLLDNLPLVRSLNDKHLEGEYLVSIGQLEVAESSYTAACEYLEQARIFMEEVGDHLGEATTTMEQSAVEYRRRNPDRAKALQLRALPVMRSAGKEQEAWCLSRLAESCEALEQFDEARTYFAQALGIFEELDVRAGIKNVLFCQRWLEKAAGETEASQLLETKFDDRMKEWFTEGEELYKTGEAEYQAGDLHGAKEQFKKALAQFQLAASWTWGAHALTSLSRVELKLERYTEARQYLEAAHRIIKKGKESEGLAFVLFWLATLERKTGNTDRARSLWQESLQIGVQLDKMIVQARCIHRLGQLALETGEVVEATALLDRAGAFARELGDKAFLAQVEEDYRTACDAAN